MLFLDELPEFSRHVLEVLREPLETGVISLARVNAQIDFPARFQLVAAMNPCPCGFRGDPQGNCRCSGDRVANYLGRISGPLLDRIDIKVEVERPPTVAFRGASREETTAVVRARVALARERALGRQGCVNGRLTTEKLDAACRIDDAGWRLLEDAADNLGLSPRGLHRSLRVARTIADLDQADTIAPPHLAEALTFGGSKPG